MRFVLFDSINENGELVCNCDTCPFSNWEDDPYDE